MLTVYAFLLSLAVTVGLSFLLIPLLARLKAGQQVRGDGPARHLAKSGTPTMGGLAFLGGLTAAVLVLADRSPGALLVLFMALTYGLTGFYDDYLKVALKRPLGLKARQKLLAQVFFAVVLVLLAVYAQGRGTALAIPFTGLIFPHGIWIDGGFWFYLVFTVFIVVGMANAVNLTDGLDGLAAGVTFWVAVAFVLAAVMVDRTAVDSSGVAIAMAALAGGAAGFLYFNRHPARVFMGDTGSLALGGALGGAAVLTKSELFFLVAGGVYVLEALSVIIQVISFQTTGRRVFRMSPLHHHFELGGWPETRVVYVFWLASLVFVLAGLAGMYGLGRT